MGSFEALIRDRLFLEFEPTLEHRKSVSLPWLAGTSSRHPNVARTSKARLHQ